MLLPTSGRISSTNLSLWIREDRPWRDWEFQTRGLQVVYRFNASHFTALALNEIIYHFSSKTARNCCLARFACHRFSTNSHVEARPERAPRKIQHAAGVYLPAGDVAPNDLAFWEFH